MASLTVSPAEALDRLQSGNRRFVAVSGQAAGTMDRDRRAELVSGQQPFAVVVGCSDSRVPAELVFDQGLGDLFVIRVAGHVVAPSQIGSVEFAVERFGTSLVVVLGHSQCGAVLATLEELQQPSGIRSANLRAIVERIQPAVEGVLAGHPSADAQQLAGAAVRANVRYALRQLRHGSPTIEGLLGSGHVQIVGAEYSLESGVVDFLDDEAG